MSLVLLASYSRYSISRTGPIPTAILYRTFTVLDKHLTVCLNLSRNMTGHMRSLYVLCMIAILFIHSAHFDFQGVLFFWDDFFVCLAWMSELWPPSSCSSSWSINRARFCKTKAEDQRTVFFLSVWTDQGHLIAVLMLTLQGTKCPNYPIPMDMSESEHLGRHRSSHIWRLDRSELWASIWSRRRQVLRNPNKYSGLSFDK